MTAQKKAPPSPARLRELGMFATRGTVLALALEQADGRWCRQRYRIRGEFIYNRRNYGEIVASSKNNIGLDSEVDHTPDAPCRVS
jgi:hypothetical protein